MTKQAWKKIGQTSRHGINVPLFSIRTEKSSGIGEFHDLLPLIDWCQTIGFSIIQLLPLNDSGKDPSPYNALSSCALHPIYLSLHALPHLEELAEKLPTFKPLNDTPRLEYTQVLKQKLAFLSRYIAKEKTRLKSNPSYDDFLRKYDEWLYPYALFKTLKDLNEEKHWNDWPLKLQSPSHSQMSALYETHADHIEFYLLLQYLCFTQLSEVKTYAEKKQVHLKGDIPILVSPDSVDVWQWRSFFSFEYVAGSPPNAFNQEGQYWGFPLYNWKAMSENHFEWWKKRLKTAEDLYHLYRIDHIIGFFRIWAIPQGESPCNGSYIPSEPALMEVQGRELLDTLITFTNMLPIGEDLGIVPPFVLKYLKEAGIPGTKVFRWQRKWDQGEAFIPYDAYEPISMTSVSTHDIDTVTLWWQKNEAEAKAYAKFKKWTYEKTLSFDQLYEILWDNHHSSSVFHINLLQEYLALFPELTWEDAEDERINYPGTVNSRNWTYRYKMPLETLCSHVKLSETMKKLSQ